MATVRARSKSRPTWCTTRSWRCAPWGGRSTTSVPRSPRAWERRGADSAARALPSELRQQRPVELRRVADVGEAEVFQVLTCHAADVVGCDALEILHEAVRGAIVAREHLRACQHVRLVRIGLVLQVVLGDELLLEPFESLGVHGLRL